MNVTSPNNRVVYVETKAGTPIQQGQVTITPFASSLRIGIPGRPVGLIWNRPSSILIQSADGDERVQTIPDITRQIEWILLGVTVLMALIVWISNRKKLNHR